jgi:membrane associated rhomboid family serine protease
VEFSSEEWADGVVELVRFSRLADARERGLVLASKEIAYGILRCGDAWLIRVSPEDFDSASEELRSYEAQLEEVAKEVARDEMGEPRLQVPRRYWSLHLVAWLFVVFAVVQAEFGDRWREGGMLSAERVFLGGEWWRTVTALTLHGDMPHVLANLVTGLLFAGLMIPAMGQGASWFLILTSGVLGNGLTAWIYFPVDHRSLGASTAVFGALGLLVGDSCGGLLLKRSGRSVWRWILPLGAGLALLAYLGAGGPGGRVDVMAHLWGFAVGLPLGALAVALRLGERTGRKGQFVAGSAALLTLVLAWGLAANRWR